MERDIDYAKRIQEKRNQQPFISQTDLVYDLLRDDIILRYRKPGSKINQDRLANLLEISRSPIRDAISRLIHDGVVVRRSKNGYYVYILTMRDAIHIAEFRTAIEVNAGILATRRIAIQEIECIRQNIKTLSECNKQELDKMILLDLAFHNLLVASSKNRYLIHAYQQYAIQFHHLRNSSMTAEMRDVMVFRHGNILTALLNKNTNQADTAIREHLQSNLEDSLEATEYFYE